MSVSDVLTIHEKIKKNIYWHLFRKLDMESHNFVCTSKVFSPFSSLVHAYIKKREIEIQENPTLIFV